MPQFTAEIAENALDDGVFLGDDPCAQAKGAAEHGRAR